MKFMSDYDFYRNFTRFQKRPELCSIQNWFILHLKWIDGKFIEIQTILRWRDIKKRELSIEIELLLATYICLYVGCSVVPPV